jgi:hypothetical protein
MRKAACAGVDYGRRDQTLSFEQRGFLYEPPEPIRELACIHGQASLLRTLTDEKYHDPGCRLGVCGVFFALLTIPAYFVMVDSISLSPKTFRYTTKAAGKVVKWIFPGRS